MSSKSLIVALVSGLLSAGLLQAQQVDVYSRPLHYERSRDYDVLHYRIHLTVDKAKRSLWGDTTVSLKPLRDHFSTCVLDAETFIVSKVESETHQPLRFVQTDTSLTVYLPHPYGYGQRLSFVVYYREDDPHVDPRKYGTSRGL